MTLAQGSVWPGLDVGYSLPEELDSPYSLIVGLSSPDSLPLKRLQELPQTFFTSEEQEHTSSPWNESWSQDQMTTPVVTQPM